MEENSTQELPSAVDEIDALAWENLQLKTELAQAAFQAQLAAFQAKGRELGARYKFDPATDRVDFSTRKITRK